MTDSITFPANSVDNTKFVVDSWAELVGLLIISCITRWERERDKRSIRHTVCLVVFSACEMRWCWVVCCCCCWSVFYIWRAAGRLYSWLELHEAGYRAFSLRDRLLAPADRSLNAATTSASSPEVMLGSFNFLTVYRLYRPRPWYTTRRSRVRADMIRSVTFGSWIVPSMTHWLIMPVNRRFAARPQWHSVTTSVKRSLVTGG